MRRGLCLLLVVLLLLGLAVPAAGAEGSHPYGVREIAAGEWYSVAIKEDGSLWAWGSNILGQLGGGEWAEYAPIQIGTDTDWASITAGAFHTVAIKTDGSLWAWGSNWRGQLGDGTTTDRHTPVRIGTATDWVSVTAGRVHTVAIRADGSLWQWGSDEMNLIDDMAGLTPTPTRIGTDTDWISVAAGGLHTAAFKANGSLWTWGDNWYGQLGNGVSGWGIIQTSPCGLERLQIGQVWRQAEATA